MSELLVTLFDRDGEVYADCETLDIVVKGDTEAEALEALSAQLLLHYASIALGMIHRGENLRNKVLRIAFPAEKRVETTVPIPSDEAIAERASELSRLIAELRERGLVT